MSLKQVKNFHLIEISVSKKLFHQKSFRITFTQQAYIHIETCI